MRVILYCLFLSFPNVLLAQDAFRQHWLQTITVVENLAQDYYRLADAKGEETFLGTAMNEVDVPRHRCSILGRMLDKTALITHLESPYPQQSNGMTTFRTAGQSLDNWVWNAQQFLELPRAQRVEIWNYECVGKMGIAATARIETGVSQETAIIHAEINAGCDGVQGHIAPDGVARRDLNGDGVGDLIIQHRHITCGRNNRQSGYCGAQVCSSNIYFGRGTHFILVEEMLALLDDIGPGPRPVISVWPHGGPQMHLRWDGSQFAEQ